MQLLSPVNRSERETFMDVLRGFAILGIFIANLHAFSFYFIVGPEDKGAFLMPGWDKKMLFLHHLFVEGKFYSIFSFLFGWGVALQLKRAQINDIKPESFVKRRLLIMLFLGALHLLLWTGDIILFYALVGFILLPLLRMSNKALIITGIILLLLPILLYGLKMTFPILKIGSAGMFKIGQWSDEKLIGVTSEESYVAYMRNANWWGLIKANISGIFYRFGDLFFQSRIPKVLGFMLLGAVVARTDFYKNLNQHKKSLYYIIAFGVIIALPANYMLAKYMSLQDDSYNQLKINGLYRTIFYALGVAPLAATYIALFMLAYKKQPVVKFLNVFAPVGKMAFTNYIVHTLIGSFVFLGPGLGYWGKVGPVYYTVFAVLVFIFQVIISTLWLNYFNYGPLEWIWRSATYKKWQPFKKIIMVNG